MFTKASPVTLDPIAVRIRKATCLPALSRSDLYRRPGRDEIVFRKSDKSVFVDHASLKAVVLSLPPARIGVSGGMRSNDQLGRFSMRSRSLSILRAAILQGSQA